LTDAVLVGLGRLVVDVVLDVVGLVEVLDDVLVVADVVLDVVGLVEVLLDVVLECVVEEGLRVVLEELLVEVDVEVDVEFVVGAEGFPALPGLNRTST
jgi:hypothetical protein